MAPEIKRRRSNTFIFSEQEDEDEKERKTGTWRKTDCPVHGGSDGCVHAAGSDRLGGRDFLREDYFRAGFYHGALSHGHRYRICAAEN